MDKTDLLNAASIGEQTLVGFIGDFPIEKGNCFSMTTDQGKRFKILNFGVENLEELIKRGLEYPIKILPVDESHAEICDERIPDEWYRKDYCSVCCLDELLPRHQKLRQFRQELRGDRLVHDDVIVIKPDTCDPNLRATPIPEPGFITSSAIPLVAQNKKGIA